MTSEEVAALFDEVLGRVPGPRSVPVLDCVRAIVCMMPQSATAAFGGSSGASRTRRVVARCREFCAPGGSSGSNDTVTRMCGELVSSLLAASPSSDVHIDWAYIAPAETPTSGFPARGSAPAAEAASEPATRSSSGTSSVSISPNDLLAILRSCLQCDNPKAKLAGVVLAHAMAARLGQAAKHALDNAAPSRLPSSGSGSDHDVGDGGYE